MAKGCYYMDKKTLREIGRGLWQLRVDRHMYLKSVAYQTNIPQRIIEGMEIGKFIQYTAFRRLLQFYGKNMKVVFE